MCLLFDGRIGGIVSRHAPPCSRPARDVTTFAPALWWPPCVPCMGSLRPARPRACSACRSKAMRESAGGSYGPPPSIDIETPDNRWNDPFKWGPILWIMIGGRGPPHLVNPPALLIIPFTNRSHRRRRGGLTSPSLFSYTTHGSVDTLFITNVPK
jgi:hypothetical protein